MPVSRNAPARARSFAVVLGWSALALGSYGAEELESQTVQNRVAVCAGNGAAALVTSSLTALVKRSSLRKAMVAGLVGGSLMCAGKVVLSTGASGTSFWARQLNAAGSGITASGGNWEDLSEHLWFPVGPFAISSSLTVRVDLSSAAVLVYGVARRDLKLDYRSSLGTGAAVFRHTAALELAGRKVEGLESHGVIFIAELEPRHFKRTLAHELVHVLQSDFLKIAVAFPIERSIRSELNLSHSRIEIGFTGVALQEFTDLLGGGAGLITRIRETEARALTK